MTTPRRGRPPKTQAQLTRAAIREAALAVIDRDGIAALSMRSVAQLLGVDAKSLYHHVTDKDDLLDAVAEHLLGQLRVPAATGVLRTDLTALAHEFRRVTLAHPEAASLVLTRQLSTLSGLAPVEAILSVLRRAGADPEHAVHLVRVLVAGLIGILMREVSAGPTFGSSDPADIAARQRALEDSGLPEVTAAAPYLARFDSDREFDSAIDLFVDVVASRLAG
ncbi:TetR family transcriptional regulator [[Mycobacterium] kokjensenii]|uniref:TetR family transcriptional regulator n=1 Tax=[Mycobacterium] kokjensenii TaxID=3064287 RepID=A0ABM9LC80_9MYCO|nr:TetR family transcriptional regulator [Mycolicibacter sp. MU0083]CAJ1496528.1 TetR family transcriptional regulator [Mycolicibacter sp. MU0083]